MGFLCRLIVNTGCAGVTTMAMHAESNAQALIAAQELFPACDVRVVCNVQARPPCRGHQERTQGSSGSHGGGNGPLNGKGTNQNGSRLSS